MKNRNLKFALILARLATTAMPVYDREIAIPLSVTAIYLPLVKEILEVLK